MEHIPHLLQATVSNSIATLIILAIVTEQCRPIISHDAADQFTALWTTEQFPSHCRGSWYRIYAKLLKTHKLWERVRWT